MPDDPDPTMLTDAELRALGVPDDLIPHRFRRPTAAERREIRLAQYRRAARELRLAALAVQAVDKETTVPPDQWVSMLERYTAAVNALVALVESEDDAQRSVTR